MCDAMGAMPTARVPGTLRNFIFNGTGFLSFSENNNGAHT